MMELVVLLLPVAALSGWIAAKRSHAEGKQPQSINNSDYFKGLNFLLNEQPDKAIDVFIQMLEVDSDTVETHLALGNLFRRRGEVDRAIRVHQNLIARPTLQPGHRSQALLELGQDYMRAGLYDRAESLFHELTESNAHQEQALLNLLIIYEKEKEWNEALQTATKLQSASGEQLNNQRAHYYCELADEARVSGDIKLAGEYLKKAQGCDKDSIRASILLGELEQQKGNYKTAIRLLKKVAQNNPVYLSIVLPSLRGCYESADNQTDLRSFLQEFIVSNQGVAGAVTLSQIIQEEDGEEAAAKFLLEHLNGYPSLDGLRQLISLELNAEIVTREDILQLLTVLLDKMVEENSGYKCTTCGFGAKTMHWLCPSCNSWSSIHPAQNLV
jgi:lipopolysaccharide biosynthesis regulator YciM